MSTSIHQGRLLTGRVWDANAAADASFVRDVIQNNALHYADESAQVLCNWATTSGSFAENNGEFSATPDSTAWIPIGPPFGPYPLRLRQNGDADPLRVRLGGRRENTSALVAFRIVVGPANQTASLVQTDGDHIFQTTSTVGTTLAWQTGVSQGSSAFPTLICLPATLTAGWMTTTSTLDTVGGNAVGVEQCLVSVQVYCRPISGSQPYPDIYLGGLYVAEYIGG
jgi:hypothetical protein